MWYEFNFDIIKATRLQPVALDHLLAYSDAIKRSKYVKEIERLHSVCGTSSSITVASLSFYTCWLSDIPSGWAPSFVSIH